MMRETTAMTAVSVLLAALTVGEATAAPVVLFHEDFEGITGPWSSGDPQRFGVPVITDSSTFTIGSADNDWYAARFEQPSNSDRIDQDVGAQRIGGCGSSPPPANCNNTIVGLVEDDAGLLIGIDTQGYESIRLEFDWRTHNSESTDRFVAGYYIGDLKSDTPSSQFDAAKRSFNLQNENHDPSNGADGAWNWDPVDGGNEGDWIELLRGAPRSSWAHAMYNLAGAENGTLWLAFWLDNGNGDFGKFDNITLTGIGIVVVPAPAALPLLLSGLASLSLLARRRRAS